MRQPRRLRSYRRRLRDALREQPGDLPLPKSARAAGADLGPAETVSVGARLGRHARACRGHPRLAFVEVKTWMARSSPAMTRGRSRGLILPQYKFHEVGHA